MKRAALLPALAILLLPASSWAGAEGPGTPQATAANATFLSNAPAPPTGRGVCVIDTGVDTDTDLGPALVGRTTSLGAGGSTDPADSGTIGADGEPMPKHGTYVAGIIASQVDGKGTSGIWPAAKIYSVRVFADGAATAQVDDYRNALSWCADRPGVRVINLSLSGLSLATSSQRASLDDKIAEIRGPLYSINVVAAAGNNGSTATVGYPATSPGVFAVGASDATGALASFSNRGVGLDINAFGVGSCVTTGRGSHLGTGDGTSYAAPVVSAVLAAMRSYDPLLSADQAEQLLLDNADSIGGVKVLNAARAFRARHALAAFADDAQAPTTGLGAPIRDACEAPPASRPGSGGVGGGGTKDDPTLTDPGPAGAQAVVTTSEPAAVAPPVIQVRPEQSTGDRHRPAMPTLKVVSLRHGVLRIKVRGRANGEQVLYVVDGRRYLRASSALKIRVRGRRWKTIRVQFQHGRDRSPTLVIPYSREF